MEKYAREYPVYEFSSAVVDLVRFSHFMASSVHGGNRGLGREEFEAFKKVTFEQKALRVYRGGWRLLWGVVDFTFNAASFLIYAAEKADDLTRH